MEGITIPNAQNSPMQVPGQYIEQSLVDLLLESK